MENNLDLQELLKKLADHQKTTDSLASLVQKALAQKEKVISDSEVVSDNEAENFNTELNKMTQQHISSLGHEPSFVTFSQEGNHPEMKSMVATSLNDHSPDFSFKQKNNFKWSNLSHRIAVIITPPLQALSEKANVLYQRNKISLKEKASTWKVLLKESIKDGIDHLTLVGDKRKIKKLTKLFQENLSLLGFSVEDVVNGRDKPELENKQVQENINQRLQEKIQITSTDENYDIGLLHGLNDKMKFEMIKKIIWPTLVKELNKTMELSIYLSELCYKDKDIKELLNFSKKNNIHSDVVVHALKKNPDILTHYGNSKQLFENQDKILSSSNKYEILIQNNLVVFNSLIKVTDELKSILNKLPEELNAQEFISQMDNQEIARKKGKETVVYNYGAIVGNIKKIKNEQVAPKVESPAP